MTRTLALFVISLMLSAAAASGQTKMPLSKVQDLVNLVKAGDRTEQQAIYIINSDGVNFDASPENLNALRRLGASAAILEAIQKVAPPPAPVRGSLSVRCAPAECVVKIDGQSIGTTTHGQLVKDGLNLGEVVVDFEKEGYLTQQIAKVKITPQPGPVLSATLEPDDTTKAHNGKALYAAMLKALKVTDNLGTFSGSGSATSYVKNTQNDFDFSFDASTASQMEMLVKNARGSLIYECAGEKCGEKKKGHFILGSGGKQLPQAMIEELEPNLRAFSEHNLTSVLESLAASAVQFQSTTGNVQGNPEQHLRAEARDRSYEVTLGSDLLPTAVAYESKAGLGSGLKITFGDYTELATGWYPRRTTIRFPDAEQHGIEVRLDKVAPALNNKK
jgi:hypothetical protein